jgi:hypothetical protein
MRGNTWSRRAAGVVAPLACFVVVIGGYWIHEQHEAAPPAPEVQAEMVAAPPPVPEPPPVPDEPIELPPGFKPLGPISKAAVVHGMNAVKPEVARCYARYGISGMAMVNVVIDRSGKISDAFVSGRFAGTPTGACVEAAVKTATFPPSDGLSTPYPFMLK